MDPKDIVINVLHVLHRNKRIIDRHDVDIGLVGSGPHDQAANAAESVDTCENSRAGVSLVRSVVERTHCRA